MTDGKCYVGVVVPNTQDFTESSTATSNFYTKS